MPAPLHGQVALSGSAQQLDSAGSASSCKAFTIKAPLSNAQPAYIGAASVSTGNGYQLDPGDEYAYERLSQSGQPQYELRPGDFWTVGTGSDKLCWLASP